MTSIDFHDIEAATPVPQEIVDRYRAIESAFDGATSPAGRLAAVADWDALRRELATWGSLVGLRFQQDTRNAA